MGGWLSFRHLTLTNTTIRYAPSSLKCIQQSKTAPTSLVMGLHSDKAEHMCNPNHASLTIFLVLPTWLQCQPVNECCSTNVHATFRASWASARFAATTATCEELQIMLTACHVVLQWHNYISLVVKAHPQHDWLHATGKLLSMWRQAMQGAKLFWKYRKSRHTVFFHCCVVLFLVVLFKQKMLFEWDVVWVWRAWKQSHAWNDRADLARWVEIREGNGVWLVLSRFWSRVWH